MNSGLNRLSILKKRSSPIATVVEFADGTPDDTRRAAEAVIDAASQYQRVRLGRELSPQTKAVLLRALEEDPSLTESLFSYAGFEIQ